jgi:DNA-binding transcriptional regulator YiaG
MSSSLRERFEQQARIEVVDQVASGSPAIVLLRPKPNLQAVRSIHAMIALRRRGVSVTRAKAVIERMIEAGSSTVLVPKVESIETLIAELLSCGVGATERRLRAIDVGKLREKTGLSQEEFALRFNLDLATLKGWEQGRRKPDLAASNYLRVIAVDPDAAERAIAI